MMVDAANTTPKFMQMQNNLNNNNNYNLNAMNFNQSNPMQNLMIPMNMNNANQNNLNAMNTKNNLVNNQFKDGMSMNQKQIPVMNNNAGIPLNGNTNEYYQNWYKTNSAKMNEDPSWGKQFSAISSMAPELLWKALSSKFG